MSEAASRWSDLFTRRNAGVLITLSLGVALHAFNGFLVATALPTAVVEIGGVELMSWSFTVYLVLAIVGGAGAARLKQAIGGRRAMILPAVVFLVGTVIAGMAPSMPIFLVGRALQGIGEGIISSLCYVLIPELFPSALIARVFGVEAMVWAVGAFGGPLLAGILTETISWRAAFFVNVPVVLVFFVLVSRVVPADPGSADAKAKAVPLARLAGCGLGIMLVAVAAITGDTASSAMLIAGALAILVGVFAYDRRRPDKLFPSDAFAFTTTVGLGLWMILLMPIAHASSSVYLNITVQHVWGYGPTVAGLIHAVMALSWSGSALVVAGVDDPRRRLGLIRIGPVLVVAGLAGIIWSIETHTAATLFPCQVLVGSGFGLCWAFLSQAIMESARPGERDSASTILQAVLSSGYALGAAVAGLVVNSSGFSAALEPVSVAHSVSRGITVGASIGAFAILAALAVRLPAKPTAPAKS